MRLIRRLFFLFCLIATGLVVWGGVYARKEGFTKSWRNTIEREFASRGYHVAIGKVTLGAFRGLVAEDVKFFQDESRSQEVAVLDDVYLDVDLSRILDKQLSINTLDVQDASLSLPLDPSDPKNKARLIVTNLSGRIVVTESLIEIVRAEAEVSGILLSLKGTLIRPPNVKEEASEGELEKRRENLAKFSERSAQLQQVLKYVNEFEFPGEKPTLDIEFRGDLRDIATTTATAKLSTSTLKKKRQPYEIQSLLGEVIFDGRSNSIELKEFEMTDSRGTLDIDASWDQELNRINFKVDSGVDLANLIGLYKKDKRLKEVVFFDSPKITAEGFLNLDDLEQEGAFQFPGEVLGEIHTEKFVSRGTVFNSLDFGFSLAGEKMYLRNLRLDHKTGVAFLNFKYEPGKGDETVKYQMEIKLDPRAFRPFFNERGRKFIDAWDFNDLSSVYIAALGQGPELDIGKWKNEQGVIDIRNFRLNGVEFQQFETEVETDQHFVWFRNVKMSREDGDIVAELAQSDIRTGQWEVKGVVSNTDHIEGAKAFSPKLSQSLKKYQISTPPTIRLHGTIDGRRVEEVGDSPRKNKIHVSFEGNSDARFEFLGKTLALSSPRGEIDIENSRVFVKNFSAGVFGGTVKLDYDSKNVRSSQKPYETRIQVINLPFHEITKLYGGYDASKGTLNADFRFSGNAGSITSLNGDGTASLSDGDLFGIPLMGPLSKMIRKSNPKVAKPDYTVVTEATGTFQVRKGVVSTEDLVALTSGFRIGGRGTISCVDQSVDFDAVVNLRSGPGRLLLTPVSELLTYNCTGTITEPVWKPKHISKMTKLPGQMLSDVANIPMKGLQGIGKKLLGSGQKLWGTPPPEEELEVRRDGNEPDTPSPSAGTPGGGPKGKISPALNNLGRQLFKKKETIE